MNTLIAIPAFNEASVLSKVIHDVEQNIPEAKIVIIDDGSTDNTYLVAKNTGATVLRHRMNRGLGGSIGTAITWAKEQQIDCLITIDADGQHDPHDILKVIQPILTNQADVVIGSRLMAHKFAMPIDRRILNHIANFITLIMFGISTTDSQSGFRALSRKAIENLTIKTNRMEVSSEIFAEIAKHKLKVKEVPIRVIYTEYSRKKGQTNLNALAVGFRLIMRLFR